ncbi:hypothetical protein BJ741DRAFT_627956 [Chytriomyces cf. hyalinus JEL632]|nr:hypothetical protein BJ741DRAFT_627956 [Chytriomyces cf. hyalinus JEL632]
MGVSDDLIPHALLTVSSTDTTQDCSPSNCNASNVAAVGQNGFWRSAPQSESTCQQQWLNARFDTLRVVHSFSIQYREGFVPPSVVQTVSNSPVVPLFVFELTSAAWDGGVIAVDATSALQCVSSSAYDVDRTRTVLDTCTIEWVAGLTDSGHTGARWTWKPIQSSAGLCRVAVVEMILTGSNAEDLVSSVVDKVGNTGPMYPTLPPPPPNDTRLPPAAIGGITVGVLGFVALSIVGLLCLVRKRNLEKRKRARRLLADSTTASFLMGQ